MTPSPEKRMPNFCNRRTPFHYTTALNTLVRLGVNLDLVDLLAVGEYENYKGEIIRQDPKPGTALDARVKITLEVGFPSAVDEMPYQFFYGLHGRRASTGAWEDAARALMAPFDAAVIRHLAIAKYRDLMSNLGLVEDNHLKSVLALFEFDAEKEKIPPREAVIWAGLFPAFYNWAGNADLVCRALECLFGHEFEIVENVPFEHGIPESCRYKLGSPEDRLGSGTIVGANFTDCDSGYEVVIKDVDVDEAVDFLPGGKKRDQVKRALTVFMPGELGYRIRVKTAVTPTEIGSDKHQNYLGYTSFLGA